MNLLADISVVAFLGGIGAMYLKQRLYKCPECLHRSDYDHIAEVTGEAPYCPYCGTKTVNIGQKYQAWAHRLGFPSKYRVITAEDSDDHEA